MSADRLANIGDRLKGWSFEVNASSTMRSVVAGLDVPTFFNGTFTDRHSARQVQMTCRVQAGAVRSDYTLKNFSDDEVESLALPMMRDVLTLLAAGSSPETRATAASELHRNRRKNAFSDERIARAAAAYATGDIEAVQEVLGTADAPLGERQAWRYVQRAIDAALVEPRGKRRKGAN